MSLLRLFFVFALSVNFSAANGVRNRASNPETMAKRLFGSRIRLSDYNSAGFSESIPVETTDELTCGFEKFCCWKPMANSSWHQVEGEIPRNRVTAAFKTSEHPEGPFLVGVTSFGANKILNSLEFTSCTFFASGSVTVSFRRWTTPATRILVCWEDVFFGRDAPRECKEPEKNSRTATVTFDVPQDSLVQITIVTEVNRRVGALVAIDDITISENNIVPAKLHKPQSTELVSKPMGPPTKPKNFRKPNSNSRITIISPARPSQIRIRDLP